MSPVLTIEPPVKVAQWQIKIPVWPPVIVPEFEILPPKLVAPAMMPMPLAPRVIRPELVMPFWKVFT